MESDDVLYNILPRLPAKALLRFRCVSKHWNQLISDPYFLKLRSRRMILLSVSRPLTVFGGTVSVTKVIGTFNGMMILALTDYKLKRCQLILHNPLTCASSKPLVTTMKIVKKPSPSYQNVYRNVLHAYVFGFGDDDLKIVRFDCWRHLSRSMYAWNVFDLKTSSWSTPIRCLRADFCFASGDAGVFLDGSLYWAISSSSSSPDYGDHSICFGILALDLKEMVFSRIKLPVRLSRHGQVPLLRAKDGRLWMISTISHNTFDLWVMRKDEGAIWLKLRSFTLFSTPIN